MPVRSKALAICVLNPQRGGRGGQRKKEEEGQVRSCPQEISVHPIHFTRQAPGIRTGYTDMHVYETQYPDYLLEEVQTHTFPHMSTLSDSVKCGEDGVLPVVAVENWPD